LPISLEKTSKYPFQDISDLISGILSFVFMTAFVLLWKSFVAR